MNKGKRVALRKHRVKRKKLKERKKLRPNRNPEYTKTVNP